MRPATLLLALLAAAAASAAAQDAAALVAKKSVAPLPPVVGAPATVTVEVFNAGSTAATDVEIVDVAPPADYFTTEGATSKKIGRVAPGASATLTYTLTATAPVSGSLDPATVTYKSGSASLTAASTPAEIYAITPLQRAANAVLKAGSVLTLGAVSTPAQWRTVGVAAGVAAVALGGKSVAAFFGDARKRRNYRKALAEVEKMK